MNNHSERIALAINNLLNRYLVRGADGRERPIPYNPVDYQSLRFIAKYPDCRATDVASYLGTPPTTMQSALDRLVRRGLLNKGDSDTDARARAYSLSGKGQAVHNAIDAQDRANVDDMIRNLSEGDKLMLVTLLERL